MKMSRTMIALGLMLPGFAALAETVTISKQDCSRLIHHQPAADVAYKPGIDAYGREVAPADLPGGGNQIKLLPEILQFNININPVDYQARNAAAKQKADAQKAIVAGQKAKSAAEGEITALNAEMAKLQTASVALAQEKAALDLTLAPLQNQVDLGQRKKTSPAYAEALAAVAAKQAEIDTNTASQDSVTQKIADQQAIVDGAPATEAAQKQLKTAAEAKQAALSAKGLDGTSMTAAAIQYDIAKNQFLINGQSLIPDDLRELAEACAKAGIK